MKKSTLTIMATIVAVLFTACGGSSSGDENDKKRKKGDRLL